MILGYILIYMYINIRMLLFGPQKSFSMMPLLHTHTASHNENNACQCTVAGN